MVKNLFLAINATVTAMKMNAVKDPIAIPDAISMSVAFSRRDDIVS